MVDLQINNNLPQEEYKNRETLKCNNYPRLCKGCNKPMPSYIIVNDKKKKIDHKRLYCLECSPYGKGAMCGPKSKFYEKGMWQKSKEGRRISYKVDRICKVCGRIFCQASRINTCTTCRNTEKRKIRKKMSIDYKGGKCEKCGYDKCHAALDFHHKNPEEKDTNISLLFGCNIQKMYDELDKCILLCSNCHRELHAEEHIVKNNSTD